MIIGRRRSRVVGAIWALVGVALVAAAILLWLDERAVSFELPAALVALLLAWSWWRQHAVLDRHGIATIGAFGERRVLWASVDWVEARRRAWFRPAIVLHPKGGGAVVPVPASAGLRRRQRNRLLEFLTDVARQHGFDLVAVTGEPLAAPGASMDQVREHVLAGAGSGAAHAPTAAVPATEEPATDGPRRPTPLEAAPTGGDAVAKPETAVDRRARMPSWLRDEAADDRDGDAPIDAEPLDAGPSDAMADVAAATTGDDRPSVPAAADVEPVAGAGTEVARAHDAPGQRPITES